MLLISILVSYMLLYVLFQIYLREPISMFLLIGFITLTIIGTILTIKIYLSFTREKKKYKKETLDTTSNEILRKILKITFKKENINKSSKEIINILKKYYAFEDITIFIYNTRNVFKICATTISGKYKRKIENHAINLLQEIDDNINAIIKTSDIYLNYPTAVDRKIRYMYFIPLVLGNELIGSVLIENKSFELEEIETDFFKIIIDNISIVLQNLIYYEKQRAFAMVDGLTQVYNRNFMNNDLPIELEKHKNLGKKFVLAIMDIDHFKKVNDTYGHLVGDIVLKAIGQHTASRIRQDIDKIYRYGGEEFIIFFSDVKIKEIFKKIEEIREEISQKIIEDNTNKNQVRVTVSFGLVEYPENGLTINKLIENVDKALYYSKNTGRNKTTNYNNIIK